MTASAASSRSAGESEIVALVREVERPKIKKEDGGPDGPIGTSNLSKDSRRRPMYERS